MDLTEKRRMEKARTPIRRRAKAHSTPLRAFRSRPPPPAAMEMDPASSSARAAQQSSGVGGADQGIRKAVGVAAVLVPCRRAAAYRSSGVVVLNLFGRFGATKFPDRIHW